MDLESAEIPIEERPDAMLALDEALQRLGKLSPRLATLVECRFFGGMTDEQTAVVLGVTDRTVRRDWLKAKGWLHQQLTTT